MNRGNARTIHSRCRNTLFQVDTVSTRQGGIKGHNIKNIEISGKQPNPHQLFFQAYRSKYLLQTLIPFMKGTHEEAHTSTSTQERLFSHFFTDIYPHSHSGHSYPLSHSPKPNTHNTRFMSMAVPSGTIQKTGHLSRSPALWFIVNFAFAFVYP